MKVHIKYFASIRETIGLSAEALAVLPLWEALIMLPIQVVQAVAETAAPLAMAQEPISTAHRVRQIPVVAAAEREEWVVMGYLITMEATGGRARRGL